MRTFSIHDSVTVTFSQYILECHVSKNGCINVQHAFVLQKKNPKRKNNQSNFINSDSKMDISISDWGLKQNASVLHLKKSLLVAYPHTTGLLKLAIDEDQSTSISTASSLFFTQV